MRARFDLMKMQQRKDEPADVWHQRVQAQLTLCGYNSEMENIPTQRQFCAQTSRPGNGGKNKQQNQETR